MNPLEPFYIQLHSPNKLIAEQYSGDRNPLFEIIYELQSQHAITWHTTAYTDPLHLHF
jgi:hypothetical protein